VRPTAQNLEKRSTSGNFFGICGALVAGRVESGLAGRRREGIIEEVRSTHYPVAGALIRRPGTGTSIACRAGPQEALHLGSDPAVFLVRGAHFRRRLASAAVASVKSDATGVNKIARDDHVWTKLGEFEVHSARDRRRG